MRKFLLLFLVLTALVWAQPEEPERHETADEEIAAEIQEEVDVDEGTEVLEEPVAEESEVETVAETSLPSGEEVEQAQSHSMDLKDLFLAGGNFMYPLLLSLLIGIAVAVERFITYSKIKIDIEPFLKKLGDLLKKGDFAGAEKFCDQHQGPVSSIMRAGILRHDKGLEAVEKAIEGAGGIEMAFLEKGIVVLASVSSIAPMLGFLGTVSGMIRAFGEIAAAKNVDANLVAGGIQEALITTAAGLTIAIPIQVFHNYFISRIGKFVLDMEEANIFLIDTLTDLEHLKQL